MWIDGGRGVICRGPRGPEALLGFLETTVIEVDPVLTVDMLKEEVLLRYFASFKSRETDRIFLGTALRLIDPVPDVPDSEWVVQPTVFSTLTNTPIAVANRAQTWKDISHIPASELVDRKSLLDRKSLRNGWAR